MALAYWLVSKQLIQPRILLVAVVRAALTICLAALLLLLVWGLPLLWMCLERTWWNPAGIDWQGTAAMVASLLVVPLAVVAFFAGTDFNLIVARYESWSKPGRIYDDRGNLF